MHLSRHAQTASTPRPNPSLRHRVSSFVPPPSKLFTFDAKVVQQLLQRHEFVCSLRFVGPNVAMIPFTCLVVVPHKVLARTPKVEPILETMGPILSRSRELPQDHLNQQLTLDGSELE